MSDPADRLNAALEGRYRVGHELGQGGMATVYLAEDLRHERKVALKVLKPELAAVVGAERFLAEIKTTAGLQHPHILPLHDSGEADGFLFYVMPYVDGESLRDRLDREKQLPVDEAIRIATAVANALDHAHRHDVIHRDIKPANILLQDGEPVVADFGIALAIGAAGGGRLTETGLSLGTPHYMSPEQATGDAHVGPAADIYAVGCVLYEMLVGEPPYTGGTAQVILGKIITGEQVSATKTRSSVPANVDAAIRKALEKLPADRFTGAQEFAKTLTDPGFRHGEEVGGEVTAASGPWKRLSVTMTAVAAVAMLAVAWPLVRSEPPLPVARYAIPFPRGGEPASFLGALDLSSDGSVVVYNGPGDQLWVYRFEDERPSPIPGTAGGSVAAVSPQGDEIAFRQDGVARRVSLQGGPVTTLVEGTRPYWSSDGHIYATVGTGLVRVQAHPGGPPEPVAEKWEGDRFLILHEVLPGGRGALVTVGRGLGFYEIRTLRLETGEMTTLVRGRYARYAHSGHVLYLEEALPGALMAARFDPQAMQVVGLPVPMVEGVADYAISDNETLVYSTGFTGLLSEFVWVTRAGDPTPVVAGWTFVTSSSRGWSLSPAGTHVAWLDVTTASRDIWVKKLDDGAEWPLTRDEVAYLSPRWSVEGDSVTFVSNEGGLSTVWTARADGTGDAKRTYDHEGRIDQGFWSPDAELFILGTGVTSEGQGSRDILAWHPTVDSVMPLLAEGHDEAQPAVSPDGRWLAYVSDESGSDQVLLRPSRDRESARTSISISGGIMPVWAPGGSVLFFVDPLTREMIEVEIDSVSGSVVQRTPLFTLPDHFRISSDFTTYGIHPDGQRFFMARSYESAEGADPTLVVLNWFNELRRLLPN